MIYLYRLYVLLRVTQEFPLIFSFDHWQPETCRLKEYTIRAVHQYSNRQEKPEPLSAPSLRLMFIYFEIFFGKARISLTLIKKEQFWVKDPTLMRLTKCMKLKYTK